MLIRGENYDRALPKPGGEFDTGRLSTESEAGLKLQRGGFYGDEVAFGVDGLGKQLPNFGHQGLDLFFGDRDNRHADGALLAVGVGACAPDVVEKFCCLGEAFTNLIGTQP